MQDFDLIETPENVELQQPLAGMGMRCMAGLVDSLIIYGILIILLLLIFLSPLALWDAIDTAEMWAFAIGVLVIFIFYWGYFVFFEMRTNGQSPGKKVMRIRVVKEGGTAITFTDVAIRNLLRVVDSFPIVYGVAGVCMFFSKKVQRLGDLAAGTVVVSEQPREYSSRTDTRSKTQVNTTMTPDALRASGLKPEEYSMLLNYCARRNDLTLDARLNVLPRILAPILARTGDTLPDRSLEAMEFYVSLLLNKAMNIKPPNAADPQPPGGAP